MARMPNTEWLGEHGSVEMTEASLNKVSVHTIAGRYPAHAAHISIRGDGHRGQSRDTRFRSAANLHGNDDVIAIEMEDTGPDFPQWDHNDGHQVPGFTLKQVVSLAEALVWAHRTHDIPLVPCPDSKDASEGIAYHRQGIDGNFKAEGYLYGGRVSDGEVWTKSFGKVCPGDRRITELLTVVIPLARRMAGLDVFPDKSFPEEVIDMVPWLMKGDSELKVPGKSYTYGDFVFLCFSGPDGIVRRHVSPEELKGLQSRGYTVVELSQEFVDGVPYADNKEEEELVK